MSVKGIIKKQRTISGKVSSVSIIKGEIRKGPSLYGTIKEKNDGGSYAEKKN